MSDAQVHIALLSIFVTVGLAIISATAYIVKVAFSVKTAADRVHGVLKDFPPHAHINGNIIYPEGFSPPVVQKMMAHSVGE